jgi:hypothetical protein
LAGPATFLTPRRNVFPWRSQSLRETEQIDHSTRLLTSLLLCVIAMPRQILRKRPPGMRLRRTERSTRLPSPAAFPPDHRIYTR